jgi:hypothetical protein
MQMLQMHACAIANLAHKGLIDAKRRCNEAGTALVYMERTTQHHHACIHFDLNTMPNSLANIQLCRLLILSETFHKHATLDNGTATQVPHRQWLRQTKDAAMHSTLLTRRGVCPPVMQYNNQYT